MRRDGYTVAQLLREHPELRVVGIAHAYLFAAEHRDRYREFFGRDGALTGPGFTDEEASVLPRISASRRRRRAAEDGRPREDRRPRQVLTGTTPIPLSEETGRISVAMSDTIPAVEAAP